MKFKTLSFSRFAAETEPAEVRAIRACDEASSECNRIHKVLKCIQSLTGKEYITFEVMPADFKNPSRGIVSEIHRTPEL